MPIQDFELYHGAVLTKVMRTDPKPTLRLVERDHTDAWGSYRVNMDVVLDIKYATAGKSSKRSPSTLRWLFGFPLSEAASLAKHPATFLALVCGKAKGSTEGEIALIEPDELKALLDLQAQASQAISVEYEPGKQLRIHTPRHDCKVPRNRIDKWKVPGV
jgi:hypothetical protein